MSSTRTNSDFLRYRDSVTYLMQVGEPFREVEDAIELAEVTPDQKAALWLLAFSMRDHIAQEHDARAYLHAVAGG